MAISTLFSTNPNLSLYGSEWRRFGFAEFAALIAFVLCVAGWVGKNDNLARFLKACVASGGLISLYAICQYFGWDPFLSPTGYYAGEGPFTIVRPPGTLGHADYLAGYLIFVFFCALALIRIQPLGLIHKASSGIAVLAAVAVLLSGTRAALAGLLAAVVTLLVLNRRPIRRQHIGVALIVLVVLAVFVASTAGAKLRARVHWSKDDLYGGARVLLWRDSLRMAMVRPVLGFGPESFVLEFPRFQSIDLARAYPDFYHESPHNMLLDALIAQGVIGVGLALASWVVAVFAGVRAWKAGFPWVGPLIAGAVGLLANQQFSVLILPTGVAFYLIQAMLIGGAIPDTPEAKPSGLWAVLAFAVAIAFTALGTRLVAADNALSLAERRIASRELAAARAAYELHKTFSPAGRTADLYYSRAMASLASRSVAGAERTDASAEALRAGARAAQYSEQRSNAWYSLAVLFASHGDQTAVERCLRNAISWAPNWFKPHWTLAQLLQLSGRHDEAMFESAAAVERDGGKNPEVTATWAEIRRKSGQP